MDWDAINSDELNSEDLDQLEKTGKLKLKKDSKSSGIDIKFSTGFGEDLGKKLIKDKEEKKTKSKMS